MRTFSRSSRSSVGVVSESRWGRTWSVGSSFGVGEPAHHCARPCPAAPPRCRAPPGTSVHRPAGSSGAGETDALHQFLGERERRRGRRRRGIAHPGDAAVVLHVEVVDELAVGVDGLRADAAGAGRTSAAVSPGEVSAPPRRRSAPSNATDAVRRARSATGAWPGASSPASVRDPRPPAGRAVRARRPRGQVRHGVRPDSTSPSTRRVRWIPRNGRAGSGTG